jgi:hypothetical protein
MGALGAGQAQALVVTVDLGQGAGPQQWDVTTVTGTYTNLAAQLRTMPWWLQSNLAGEFATKVGAAFGSPNSFPGGNNSPNFTDQNRGPYFAFADDSNDDEENGPLSPATYSDSYWWSNGGNVGSSNPVSTIITASLNRTWAVAVLNNNNNTPVPGPLPVFGAAAAFGFSRKLRKRIKDSKAVGGSITVD